MTATEISDALERHFHDHRYPIANIYVFAWESDFLTVTKDKLIIEYEIKLSLSDFRADFEKKDKHRLLSSFNRGGLSVISSPPTYSGSGKAGYQVEIDRKIQMYTWDETRSRRVQTTEIVKREVWDYRSEIRIINIADPLRCPNRFFYVAPPGVIPIELLPPYAGLIEVDGLASVVRRAPLLHKTKHNFNGEFLEKYFWKYRNLNFKHIRLGDYVGRIENQNEKMRAFIAEKGLADEYENTSGLYLQNFIKKP